MTPTDILWPRLGRVQTLRFESLSRTGIGWSGVGAGQVEVGAPQQVEVSAPQEDVLVWKESGQWRQNGGREIRFSNTFRWTRTGEGISLEHLRFGEERPVFLFQLVAVQANEWRDVEPHL